MLPVNALWPSGCGQADIVRYIYTGEPHASAGRAPAAVEEGHAEGAQAAKLGVALLAVAEGAHQLLHGNGLLVRKLILLRRQPALVLSGCSRPLRSEHQAEHTPRQPGLSCHCPALAACTQGTGATAKPCALLCWVDVRTLPHHASLRNTACMSSTVRTSREICMLDLAGVEHDKADLCSSAPVMPATAQATWSSSLYIFSRRTPTALVSSSCSTGIHELCTVNCCTAAHTIGIMHHIMGVTGKTSFLEQQCSSPSRRIWTLLHCIIHEIRKLFSTTSVPWT